MPRHHSTRAVQCLGLESKRAVRLCVSVCANALARFIPHTFTAAAANESSLRFEGLRSKVWG
eukprot:886603-Rhodomonas_salina.1